MTTAARHERRPAAFLDRDGVINIDTGYVVRPADLRFTPTAAAGIARLNRHGYLTIVVTNQSGVARGFFTLDDVDHFHAEMNRQLVEHGARIDAFYVAPWHPDGCVKEFAKDNADRKPGSGMILRAIAEWPVDPANSFLVGDKESDMAAARGAGIRGVLVEANSCDLDKIVTDCIAGALDRSADRPNGEGM